MRNKARLLSFIVMGSLLLSACGTAPTITVDQVQTVAALTFQAMTAQPVGSPIPPSLTSEAAPSVTEPPASQSTPVPTPTPVSIPPRGSFIPYPADACEALRGRFESTLGVPVTVESIAFADRLSGGTGTACRVLSTGTAADYAMAGGPLGTLMDLLPTLGWTEDNVNYGAGGPTGTATGYRKGGALGLLSVMWHPSEDADCPEDQPISACPLTPQQKLYEITFDAADMVVYNPPAEDECASLKDALQPAFPIPLNMQIVDFTDFEQNRGMGCQVHAQGNGITFNGVGETVQAIDAVLVPLGWTLVNGADGPAGSGSEYSLGDLVAVVFVKWVPAPDANCPQDQPISACPLTSAQKLFTVTITFGQK